MANKYTFYNEYGNCSHNIPEHITSALNSLGKLIAVEADKCDLTEARLLWLELSAWIYTDCCEYMLRRQLAERKAKRGE